MTQVKHNDWLCEQLKDPTAEYLKAAAEDEEPEVFQQALRKVADVQELADIANWLDTQANRSPHPQRLCLPRELIELERMAQQG